MLLRQARALAFNLQEIADGIVEFTIKDAYLADEIMPSAPGVAYSYMENQDGFAYIVVQGIVENISENEIDFGTAMTAVISEITKLYIFAAVEDEIIGEAVHIDI